MFGNHATSVTHGEYKDLTNDFEYPEKGKKFVSVNWTTKEDNRDIVAGTLTKYSRTSIIRTRRDLSEKSG